MDTPTFLVEMTKALVWPAIAAFVIIGFRPHLPEIFERLSSIKLPGGAEAAFFEKKFDQAQNEANQLKADEVITQGIQGKNEQDETRRRTEAFQEVKQVSKNAAIIVSFQPIEKGLLSVSARRKLPFAATPSLIVDEMEENKIGGSNLISLLRHLIEIKNAAAHSMHHVTSEQADSFQQLCDLAALRLKEIK